MKIIKPDFELCCNLTGEEILEHIERCGRVCYKSEDKITESSAPGFIRSIINRGHESVLEHVSVTARIITDRGVTHEIVRHRIASYSQESTRYCVAGNMKLTTSNPHTSGMTVEDLYQNKVASKNGAWKRMQIRQFDEATGELRFAGVKDVTLTGERPCILLRTKLGYELICTPDHAVLTPNGYIDAGELTVGAKVYVNGTADRRIHSQNLQTAYADEIVEICDAGVRTVYDIEMDSDSHNFVANGVIVHNCNYSSGKFGNEITVVSPTSLEPGSSAYTLWEVACKNAETAYFLMLESGCTPQIARSVLPNSLKAEIMMTANLREWRHFFALRCSAAAHPSMREVALIGLRKMHEAIPVVFDDLASQYLTEGGESL